MKKTILTNVSAILLLTTTLVACSGSESDSSETKTNPTPTTVSALSISLQSELPELHKIEVYTFQAPYSCNGDYAKSALFLSIYSKKLNAPDLLFNGACNSPLYIHADTAGDDFALISDLGDVSLESVSASRAIDSDRTFGMENTFKSRMPVVEGHTYSVLISKSEIRALYVLKIDKLLPDGTMEIRYAVKSYSIQETVNESPNFDWEKGNQ